MQLAVIEVKPLRVFLCSMIGSRSSKRRIHVKTLNRGPRESFSFLFFLLRSHLKEHLKNLIFFKLAVLPTGSTVRTLGQSQFKLTHPLYRPHNTLPASPCCPCQGWQLFFFFFCWACFLLKKRKRKRKKRRLDFEPAASCSLLLPRPEVF